MSDNNGLVKRTESFQAPANSPVAFAATGSPDVLEGEIVGESPRRSRPGMVTQMAIGISGVLWTLRNPSKTFWRLLGFLSGCSAVGILLGFGAHLLVGTPGNVRLARPIDPAGWGAMGADLIRTPFFNSARYTNDILTTPPSQNPALLPQSPGTVQLDEEDAPSYRR